METKSTHIRVFTDTRRILRIAAAIEDVTLAELVHRLAVAELARVQGAAKDV